MITGMARWYFIPFPSPPGGRGSIHVFKNTQNFLAPQYGLTFIISAHKDSRFQSLMIGITSPCACKHRTGSLDGPAGFPPGLQTGRGEETKAIRHHKSPVKTQKWPRRAIRRKAAKFALRAYPTENPRRPLPRFRGNRCCIGRTERLCRQEGRSR